jgi:hypothetical protein
MPNPEGASVRHGEKGFDVAQICPNGHVANCSTQFFAEENKAFCDRCGEATMTACPSCTRPIRGSYWGIASVNKLKKAPAFCIQCGKQFPWTERRIQAAMELFADEVTPDEAQEFKKNVEAIAQDTPAAQVASNRISRALSRIGGGAANAIRDILVDVASEAVKKTMFPTP